MKIKINDNFYVAQLVENDDPNFMNKFLLFNENGFFWAIYQRFDKTFHVHPMFCDSTSKIEIIKNYEIDD